MNIMTGKQTEGSGFSSKFDGRLNIRCGNINEPIGLLYIEPPKWLRYKNATVNPINIDDRCRFQCAFILKQHHKETRNHPETVSITKPFLDLYNWSFIEYPTVINKNDYVLFEKLIQKLLMLCLILM